ncbi:hypothetical protein [Polyangium fumosum]|nr:hypothetical protein [Polyangium fumosum]
MRSVLLTAIAGATMLVAGQASALSPERVRVTSRGGLEVTFNDSAERTTQYTYVLSYSGMGEFTCSTADAQPLSLPQFTEERSISGSASVEVWTNISGRLPTTTITTDPPEPPELDCPAGYDRRLRVVRYQNIRLERVGIPPGATNVPGTSREIFLLRTP